MALVEDLIRWIADIIASMSNWVTNQINALINFAKSVFDTIKSVLTGIFDSIKVMLQSLVTQIQSLVSAIITQIQGAFQTLLDAIWGIIEPFVVSIKAYINAAINGFVAFINNSIASVTSYIEAVVASIYQFIKDLVTPFGVWFEDVSKQVSQLIDSAIELIEATYKDLVKDIKEAFDTLLDGANSLIAGVNEKLQDVKQGLTEAGQAAADILVEKSADIMKPLTEILDEMVKPFKSFMDEESADEVTQALLKSFSPNTLDLTSREAAHAWVQKLMPKSLTGRVVWGTILGLFLAKDVYAGVVNANAQVILQEFAAQFPYQLLTPADTVLAMYRGSMSRQEAILNIQRQGYSAEDAETLLKNAESLPNISDALVMKLRGIITAEDYQDIAVRGGYSKKYQDAIEQMGQVIPPVSDLIQMAVKGAFSPEETALFRTDEDFPEEITKWCEKQGLDDEWMRKYWRAHWNLPSPTQGFEMFQRGIISSDELNVLLKALDITPFWRDNLIKLSYNVLGRVDIRRIHQLGMMDHAELVKAHLELGYSPEDAEKLSIFTEELNQGKPGEADEELGRLSRTNVVNFYQDGVITRERAIELLIKIGYTADAATLFIDTADFEAERVTRAAEIEFILASAVAGVLDFGEAQDKLSNLKLSPTELDRATAKLLREQQKRTKLPTVEQGTKMYQAKIIGKAEFGDLLRRLGYREAWAQAFIELADQPDKKPS